MTRLSQLYVRRLRVLKGNEAAYDAVFHSGVNIIHGENSSGKSTIADFLFFALGGEFDKWKDAARYCSAVQVEIETSESILTLHRSIASRTEPALVFYGTMDASQKRGIGEWERLPIRRPSGGKDLSLSQVLFRAAGIPEAPNAGDSNITMHQILRLLYADQQTPTGRLFRFEGFDTRDIREAVGQLLIGVNGYDLYEGQIRLRELKSQYSEKDRLYKAAMVGLPSSEGLTSMQTLSARLEELTDDRNKAISEIKHVDELVNEDLSKSFLKERRRMLSKVRSASTTLSHQENQLLEIQAELIEITEFYEHLESQMMKLRAADTVAEALGEIEFQYCPSCLKPLNASPEGHCFVCHQVVDEEAAKSKFFELKLDVELQTRETAQVAQERKANLEQLQAAIRLTRREFTALQLEFSARYDVSNSPRETFLAEKNQSLGRIERELVHLEQLKAVLERVDRLSAERAQLNDEIVRLDAQLAKLAAAASKRKSSALGSVSTIALRILKGDLKREDTFETAKSLVVDFGDDAILLDGKMNFAESSNVILKNTAILSLFLAACYDREFWHPRLLIFDNVEDKGMEMERSHNFQRIIIKESSKALFKHQIIFTTSMLAPELTSSEYVIGEKYTRTNKTLKL